MHSNEHIFHNNDIIREFSDYLNYYDNQCFVRSYNYIQQRTHLTPLRQQYDSLTKHFMCFKDYHNIYKYFEDTFFPIRLMQQFPVLEFRDQFVGEEDYIDRIQPEDLENHPIMIGLDRKKRPFVCIKYFDKKIQKEDT
jgi:hypothetical protein